MGWLRFLTVGQGIPLTLYAVFQIGALVFLRGRWRIAVSAPLLLVVLVFASMAWAHPKNHTAWLMILLVVAPGAVLSIMLTWLAEVAWRRRAGSAVGLAILCGLAIWAVANVESGYGRLWRSEWAIGWTIVTAGSLLGFGLVTSQLRR